MTALPQPPHWMARGSCADLPAEIIDDTFFPETDGGSVSYAAGKRLCRGCDVRLDCQAYGLAEGFEHGLFGGLTPADRDRLLRARVA